MEVFRCLVKAIMKLKWLKRMQITAPLAVGCLICLFFIISNYETKYAQPSLQYDYTVYGVSVKKGKAFNVSARIVHEIGMPLSNFIHLDNVDDRTGVLNDFVFVTGASGNYLGGLYALINSTQWYYKHKTVIVYNLGGILETDLLQLSELCNVVMRRFEFERYPAHVRSLYNYAWKPLIIHEVLRTHAGVFWLDSSARMNSSHIKTTLMDAKHTNGITLIRNTGHSIYAVTHPQMYEYLPSFQPILKYVHQREAGATLIYRTEEIYSAILVYWVLCALDEKCIGSADLSRHCSFGHDWWTYYANCHRYDQSAINIILANYFTYDDMAYKSREEPMAIMRGVGEVLVSRLKMCMSNKPPP